MIRLTKELMLISTRLISAAERIASQELDFNLARRSGVVVNSIESTISSVVAAGDVTDNAVQEVDLDPDNVDVQGGSVLLADTLEMDSSRLLRHYYQFISRNGTAEAVSQSFDRITVDFRHLPLEERPLSITNLRHHLRFIPVAGAGSVGGLILLRYIIVELSLQELGIINAGRR